MATPFGAKLPRDASMEVLRELYLLGKNKSCGKIFYVNATNGNTANDGLSPDSALVTIAAALAKCGNDHDDYIIVMDCYQQETFPIEITTSRVHILGVGHWGGMFPQMTPPTNTAIFTINTKGYVEIAYFNLGAGATHASIEFISTISEGRAWIHDIWFGHNWAGQDGIRVNSGTEAPENLIEDCVFGKLLTRDGIRIEGQSTRTIIRNNIFRKVPGIGINVVATGTDLGAIIGNKFNVGHDAGTGEAITIATGAVGCLVDDNHAMHEGDTLANNPYVDNGACDWGLNYAGITATYPV